MLQLSNALINQPVVSVRAAAPIATAISLIINPNNLKIEGWHCTDRFSKQQLVLQTQDVRDIIADGIVVNDHDSLAPASELVRLKDILNINFQTIGKTVESSSGEKLGKVSDFACDIASFYIQKLYVSQPLIKSFTGGSLTVDRTQIVEITNKKIVIQDPLQGVQAGVAAQAAMPAN